MAIKLILYLKSMINVYFWVLILQTNSLPKKPPSKLKTVFKFKLTLDGDNVFFVDF